MRRKSLAHPNKKARQRACIKLGFLLLVLIAFPASRAAVALSPSNRNSQQDRCSSVRNLIQEGTQRYSLGEKIAAIVAWEDALQSSCSSSHLDEKAKLLYLLGKAYYENNQHTRALVSLKSFKELPLTHSSKSLRAKAMMYMGLSHYNLGEYQSALSSYAISAALFQQLGQTENAGRIINNVGNTFYQIGDYKKAAFAYEKSLEISEQLEDVEWQMANLSNLGQVYSSQGKADLAIDALERGLALDKNRERTAQYANLLLHLGSLHLKSLQLDKAERRLEEGFQLASETEDQRLISATLATLAFLRAEQKEFSQAVELYEQSLKTAKDLRDPLREAETLNNYAHTLYISNNLGEADIKLKASISLLDQMRGHMKRDEYNVSLFDTQIMTYTLLQQVAVAQQDAPAALEASEQGRARAFSTLLSERNQLTDKPPNIQTLKQIAQEQNATIVEYSLIPPDDFIHQGKQTGWEKASELYIWVVHPTGEIDLRQVDLDPWWQKSPLLNTTLEKGEKAKLTLSKLIQESRYLTTDAPNTTPTNAIRPVYTSLNRLHQILIDPIQDLLPKDENQRIIFAPQDALFLAPFAAIQDDQGRYLIEKHTILTIPAIQTLTFTRKQRPKDNSWPSLTSNALIVGNPTMPTLPAGANHPAQQLPALPSTGTEAFNIGSFLSSTPLLEEKATKAAVMEQMPHAKIIHLATHGLLDYGSRSFGALDAPGAIALAPDPQEKSIDPDAPPNGILTSREIMELDLNASLVVLSACDTGQGTLTGDGVIGLARAFIAAGTSSILVSLWQINDEVTAIFMTDFYENLRQHPDKAQALRQAMLARIQDPETSDPFYWSAFSLIGEAE